MTSDGRRNSLKNLGAGARTGNPLWQKGKSANPGGRPKADKTIRKLISAETVDGEELVAYALGTMRATPIVKLGNGKQYRFFDLPDDSKSRNYAHDWLTVRCAGKAPMVLTVENESPESAVNFNALTEAQLDALAALDAASEPINEPDEPDADALPPAPDGQN